MTEDGRGRPINEADDSTWEGRVGARIRELRMRKYRTQDEFVEALSLQGVVVKRISVSDWENGKSMPRIQNLPAIAAALEVKVRTVLPDE